MTLIILTDKSLNDQWRRGGVRIGPRQFHARSLIEIEKKKKGMVAFAQGETIVHLVEFFPCNRFAKSEPVSCVAGHVIRGAITMGHIVTLGAVTLTTANSALVLFGESWNCTNRYATESTKSTLLPVINKRWNDIEIVNFWKNDYFE